MEQTIKLKLQRHGKWETIDMPPPEQCTAVMFKTWVGKPCILEFTDVQRKYYAFGNDEVEHYCPDNQVRMDMEAFCSYWMMKLLEFGIDTFTKIELAEERTKIMQAEGESVESIAAVIASRPDLYQPELPQFPEDF